MNECKAVQIEKRQKSSLRKKQWMLGPPLSTILALTLTAPPATATIKPSIYMSIYFSVCIKMLDA